MADSGLLRFISRGLRFVTSKASATYVGLKTAADPAASFDIVLPNALPTVIPQPLAMGLDGIIRYGSDSQPVFAVTASKTLGLADSNAALLCQATCTITVPANASVPFPIGTEVMLFINTTGTVTIALSAGVTVTDRNGTANTLTTVSNYTLLKKIAVNTWLAVNPVSNNVNLPGTPTSNTAAVGNNSTALATTAFVRWALRPMCILSRTTTGISCTAGPFTTLVLNNKIRDADNAYNSSTGVFTAPYAGFYSFTAFVRSNAVSCTQVLSTLVGGVELGRLNDSVVGAAATPIAGSVTVYMAANTPCTLSILYTVAAITAFEASTTSRVQCHASINYLGDDA